MNGQLDEMRAEQRPWVSIEPTILAVTWDKTGVTVDMKYTVKNTGRSPAMHVEVEDQVVPWLAQPSPFDVLKKMTAAARKIGALPIGFPLFPREERDVFSVDTFSREDMDSFFGYLTKFKHSPTDPDMPLDAVKQMLTLTVVYLVGYAFVDGTVQHQHSCLARISRVLPGIAINIEGNLPLEMNLHPPDVRLVKLGMGCEAD